jgi:2-oxoglutarate ferredoxin oxidoreductase subunit alpha
LIVLAPSSVQEMADFVYDAFDLADKYRNPVMILADGALGQMMEKVAFRDYNPKEHTPAKPWATTGKPRSRERNIITSLFIEPREDGTDQHPAPGEVCGHPGKGSSFPSAS